MRQPCHIGGTISSPLWNDRFTRVKRYNFTENRFR